MVSVNSLIVFLHMATVVLINTYFQLRRVRIDGLARVTRLFINLVEDLCVPRDIFRERRTTRAYAPKRFQVIPAYSSDKKVRKKLLPKKVDESPWIRPLLKF